MAEISKPNHFRRTSAKPNILLVDDQPANLLALEAILSSLEANLVAVSSGEEALCRMKEMSFAVVLLDVQMNGLDGFETAQRIRRREGVSHHTPIIFVSAFETDPRLFEQGYAFGAVDFLVKPLASVIVRAKVARFIELFQEKEQARSEAEQLRLLIHGTVEYAIFMLDTDGRIMSWNPGAERIKGYRADEIIGSHFSRFYPQEALDRGWPAHELKVARTEGRYEEEGWRLRKDGTPFWANVVITALRDELGELRGFSKLTRDLTEKKKAEETALRIIREEAARRSAEESAEVFQEQRERLQVTLASIGDAVITADVDGRVTFLNSVAHRLTGWSTEEAEGMPLLDVFNIVNEHTRKPVENPALRAVREGIIVGLANHTILVAKDGTERPIDDSAAPIRNTRGEVIGGVLVFRDITARKKSEALLAERVELLALGSEVGQALTVGNSLQNTLQSCAGAIVEHLQAAFARIWTLNADTNVLELQASAGLYTHLDGAHSRVPVGMFKIGWIAQERKPHLTNSVIDDPRVSNQDWARREEMVAFAGYPLVVEDRLVGVMAMFARRQLSEATLEALASVANGIALGIERYRAEEELRRSELELVDFFENAAIGLHWVGPDGIILRVNRAELEMLGYRREEYLGRPIADFHADPQAIDDILQRLHDGEKLSEYPARLKHKDGSIKDVLIDSSALRQDGKFIHTRCFTRDVTESKRAAEEIRFQAKLLDAVGQAAIVSDPDGTIIYWNRFAETLYGWSKSEVLGRNITEVVVPPANRPFAAEIMNRLGAAETWSGEIEVRNRQGESFIVYVTDSPVLDDRGNVKAIIGISSDITHRKRVEQGLQFLANASASLSNIVDYQSTLQKVAGLAVPHFADWCAVDMVEADGSLNRLAVVHPDPAKVKRSYELHRRYPPDTHSIRGISHVIQNGASEIMTEISDEALMQGTTDEIHLQLLRELGMRSYMCVPLKGRRKLLGAISFVSAESGRRYTEADLAFAEELAIRAAIAIENAQLYTELRDTDRRKDEFLATLAHELRNPLAPIRNSLQILKMAKGEPATIRRLTDMMERQVHHLVRLVDDLLDVSRVMRGKIVLRKERIDLASIVARAVETTKPFIESQGHELTIRLPTESVFLEVDPVRITQVIGNLLANAAKYTEPTGRIQLVAERDGEFAVLRVRDNGIGIAPNMLPQIFELFVQVDHEAARSQGGLGIGLTLVKNLVEMHKGQVSARSEGLGCGSEFEVRLPLAPKRHEPFQPKDREAEKAVPPASHRLLVVDDNTDAAESLAILLRLQGHEVRVAHRGVDALEIATSYRPAMIFLDIGMPGMDGYEVARRLRLVEGLEKVELAALTGWGQIEDRRRTAEAGFDHHLVKPVEPKALETLLGELKQPGT